jgi:hypothetical protein
MPRVIVTNPRLSNAQSLAKQYPETFEVPSQEQLNNLNAYDTVKICRNGERFHVTILYIDKDGVLYGQVDDKLVLVKSFRQGDILKFEKKNIYSIVLR